MEAFHGTMQEHESAHSDVESESMQSEPLDDTNNKNKNVSDGVDNESVESGDDDKNAEVWNQVMWQVADIGGHDLFTEDGTNFVTKKTVKQIRNYVEDIVTFAHDIENSDIYVAIQDEKSWLEDKHYSEEEAEAVAWKNRKYLIKQKVIEPFKEEVQRNHCERNSEVDDEDDASTD